ncbi:hypothetical protein BGZ72_000110 [Mortierella alpina]|nr:hypothetical protein BGZ72_000110 [Mortierella alpina]
MITYHPSSFFTFQHIAALATRDCISHLPVEMHSEIASYLSPSDLAACVRVNKTWFALYSRDLWKSIDLLDKQAFYRFALSAPAALVRNGHLLRDVHTEHYLLVRILAFGHNCTNLKSLQICSNVDEHTHALQAVDIDFLAEVLRRNPGIELLQVHDPITTPNSHQARLFHAIPPGLTDLVLGGGESQRSYLRSEGNAVGAFITCDADIFLDEDPPTFSLGLKSLVMLGSFDYSHALFQFLSRCQSLAHIELSGREDIPVHDLCCVFQRYCPNLTSLRLLVPNYQDPCLAHMICSGSVRGWRHLHLLGSGLGPQSRLALFQRAGTLESLGLDLWDSLTSSEIQQFLCSASQLRKFVIEPVLPSTSGRLHARDVIRSRWACQSLEILKVVIDGIPRPDLWARTNGRPLEGPMHEGSSMEESFQIQRRVYEQLGSLSRLRMLDLGISMRAQEWDNVVYEAEVQSETVFLDLDRPQHGRQYECLSFTLESGLGLLGGLKMLETLQLQNMAAGFENLKEQQWAEQNWPCLEEVLTLEEDGLIDLAVEEW